MAKFGFISVADEEEYNEKYSMFKLLDGRFKKMTDMLKPDYIAANIYDMGLEDVNISGFRICIPPVETGNIKIKKLNRAISYCRKTGAEALSVDSSVDIGDFNIAGISKVSVYTPVVIIDAIKSVASLLGINFRRSNICIADASTNIGLILAELLSNEVSYMTLITPFRENVLKSAYKLMIKGGLSPAIVWDYKRALVDCDILLYVGGIDINELAANIHKKVIIANFTSEVLYIEKDLLVVDDAVLRGNKEPIIKGYIPELTSRVWEGALLTQCNIDVNSFSVKDVKYIRNIAKDLKIEIKTIMGRGQPIGRERIYKYR